MKKNNCLSSADREFFTLVDKAITTNPFSDQRKLADLRIAGLTEKVQIPEIDEAIKKIGERITALKRKGLTKVDQFCEADRKLLEHVFLFQFFYSFRDKFDQFILDQIKAGDISIPVPFVPQIHAFFLSKGFDPGSINRYISVCYQVRRAFYFINRTLIGTSAAMNIHIISLRTFLTSSTLSITGSLPSSLSGLINFALVHFRPLAFW